MRYIIQAVPERDLSEFTEKIKTSIPECYTDHDHNPNEAFMSVLRMAGDDAFVRLEDDIELCDNFTERMEKVIDINKDTCISFFTLRKIDCPTYRAGRDFCMAQAVYFPEGMAKEIIDYYYSYWKANKESANPTALDFIIADYLQAKKLKYLIAYPNLVQHKIGVSMINPKRSKKRISKVFQK